MGVNTTCVSPEWISVLVNDTGRSTRGWKFHVGPSPRRFGGPPITCHICFAKEPSTRNPCTLDPNPDAIPCNRGQCREQKTLCLYGICKPVQPSATTDRTLVMSRGKRFESARRLSRIGLSKLNNRKRKSSDDKPGLSRHSSDTTGNESR